MNPYRRNALTLGLALCAPWALGQGAAYPSRTIKVLVPFTPGSGSDSSARYFGARLGKLLGQSVVVENKPGAGGVIALQVLKQAPADGYTIVLASNSPMSVNPVVMKEPGYDALKDFKPLSGLTRGMNVLLVGPNSRFTTVEELLATAKKSSLTVGTYSAGYHLAVEWLASLSGAKFTNVPYKGQAPVMTDLIGGKLDFAFVDLGGATTLINSGRGRPLAVSGDARNIEFPHVPTIRAKGFEEYVQYSWVSFYVLAQTPDAITQKLADAMQTVLAEPESREFIRTRGGELMPHAPAQMRQFQRQEIERFRKIASVAGIKPE